MSTVIPICLTCVGSSLTRQDLLFRVIDKGHEYKIYSNGEIEGFGDGALVFNYFPQVATDYANSILEKIPWEGK